MKKLIQILNEMPYGPNGYFPPQQAHSPRQAKKEIEEIYTGNTALHIASKMKKIIDKYNKKQFFIAPFVNYYPRTSEGNLILGCAFVSTVNGEYIKVDDKLTKSAEKEIENVLKGNWEIWHDYHRGISGSYNGENWKSAIVYSIVTPGRQFNEEAQNQLEKILGL